GLTPGAVFAPTDEAFAKLPAGTVEDLLKPENKARLQRILTYHVVAGRVPAAEVVKMSTAKTVSGDAASIRGEGTTVRVGNARVIRTDIAATNGVIHAIDTVLLPSVLCAIRTERTIRTERRPANPTRRPSTTTAGWCDRGGSEQRCGWLAAQEHATGVLPHVRRDGEVVRDGLGVACVALQRGGLADCAPAGQHARGPRDDGPDVRGV